MLARERFMLQVVVPAWPLLCGAVGRAWHVVICVLDCVSILLELSVVVEVRSTCREQFDEPYVEW